MLLRTANYNFQSINYIAFLCNSVNDAMKGNMKAHIIKSVRFLNIDSVTV